MEEQEITERPEASAEEISASVNEKSKKKKLFESELLDWFDTVVGSVLAIIVIFTFFTRLSTVDGSSMLPTLHDKERMLVSDFCYTPDHNDIIVLWAENLYNEDTQSMGKAIVKRIIGLPGDTIEIDFSTGVVYRNGEALALEVKDGILYEDGHTINDLTLTRINMNGAVTVPEGYLFVMGDNRNGSSDSRDSRIGLIDIRDVVGRVYLRVSPLSAFGGVV